MLCNKVISAGSVTFSFFLNSGVWNFGVLNYGVWIFCVKNFCIWNSRFSTQCRVRKLWVKIVNLHLQNWIVIYDSTLQINFIKVHSLDVSSINTCFLMLYECVSVCLLPSRSLSTDRLDWQLAVDWMPASLAALTLAHTRSLSLQPSDRLLFRCW